MQPPRIGSTHQRPLAVEASHTVTFAGLLPVLATPWLIWFLEHAAFDLLAECLEEGEMSVGTYVELEHLAPALTGDQVACRARVINVDGTQVTFAVEAAVGQTTIARGVHRRRVVETARLARRLSRSTSGT